jgi:uncharacterized membrane protein
MRRTGLGLATGAAVLLAAGFAGVGWWIAVTGGWAAAAFVILVWTWLAIGRMNAAETAAHAVTEDLSRVTADIVLLIASTASLVAVGFVLVEAGNHHGGAKVARVALAIVTVALSWATVHTRYALRYGDLYYAPPVGGVEFNEDDPPDYLDFAYLGLTIGMTFQVSDTNLSTKAFRRAATRHALLSYLFGAVIVALVINTVSSLLR